MQEFDNIPFYSGPIYFFDQLKPQTRKWTKKIKEDEFLYLTTKDDVGDLEEDLGHVSHITKQSTEQKEAQENTGAFPAEDKASTLTISEPPSVSKIPSNPEIPKPCLHKTLFVEYKLVASEILYELEETLKKYAENGMPFPVGLVNLITYSWRDLTEDSYRGKSPSKMLVQDKVLGELPSSMTVINLKESKIKPEAKKPPRVENRSVKQRKSQALPNKSFEKMSVLSQTQESFHTPESKIRRVIHFSLTSKICFENGWIPCSKSEIAKWKADLKAAVKRLQVVTVQIKAEEAKEGYHKQPILLHYGDPGEVGETDEPSSQESQFFWMDLLIGKAQMPDTEEADLEVKKFHYALVDGSSLTKTIAMMITQDGGMLMNQKGGVTREWTWPSKGKFEDPIEVRVNKYITVTISGRFAVTLVFKRHSQSLKLSLAPVKHKRPHLPDKLFPDINPSSREPKEILACYKRKCRLMDFMAQSSDASNLADPVDTDSDDPGMEISLMHDLVTAIKLSRMQQKVKHLLLHWLNYYRSTLGLESMHVCKLPIFAKRKGRKTKVSFAIPGLNQSAKEADWYKEYLRYRNDYLTLTEFFKPLPYHYTHRTPVVPQHSRLPLLTKSKDLQFTPQLACPVVLRKTICGEKGNICRCSCHIIPEVTDLEYDHLIRNQLSHVDQIIVVCVFSAKKKEDKTIEEVTNVYKEINKSRSMPCIQSHLDSFRLLKYDITSASKFAGPGCPLLVRRHNLAPGIFLMYIRGKLLFANFIFNGYSTSANDLQKQIVRTRKDYRMGYFLPSDFTLRNGSK